jgi:hypothetical protein
MPEGTAAFLRVSVWLDSGNQPILTIHSWNDGKHSMSRYLVKNNGVMNLDPRGTSKVARNHM